MIGSLTAKGPALHLSTLTPFPQSQVVLADGQAAMAGSTVALSALSVSGGPAMGMGRLAAW